MKGIIVHVKFKTAQSSLRPLSFLFFTFMHLNHHLPAVVIYIHTHKLPEKARIEALRRDEERILSKNRMDCCLSSLLLLCLLLFCVGNNEAFNLSTISFDEGYTPLFGDGNLVRSPNGRSVRLLLDRFTGRCLVFDSHRSYIN